MKAHRFLFALHIFIDAKIKAEKQQRETPAPTAIESVARLTSCVIYIRIVSNIACDPVLKRLILPSERAHFRALTLGRLSPSSSALCSMKLSNKFFLCDAKFIDQM